MIALHSFCEPHLKQYKVSFDYAQPLQELALAKLTAAQEYVMCFTDFGSGLTAKQAKELLGLLNACEDSFIDAARAACWKDEAVRRLELSIANVNGNQHTSK